MTKRIPGGFEKLRQSIISSAADTLEKLAPEHVRAFRETIEQGEGPEQGLEQGLDSLSGIDAGPQFKKWSKLCIDLIDVELQMHRIQNSLELIKSPAYPPLNQGEWVEYHCDAWAILMLGLLYRIEKLTKNIVRELVRPANTKWKFVETETLQIIKNFQSRVKVIRDPIAHTGGAVEAIANGHRLEMYLLIGGRVPMKHILEPMAGYQRKWHQHLSNFSTQVFTEIDTLSEHLHREVK